MYGPDPQEAETLYLGLCHDKPSEPFACFFRKRRRMAEKVALREGTMLSLRCICCTPARCATVVARHDAKVPAATPKKLFVFGDGTEVEREEYVRRHVRVVARVLCI